ncbi:MAG: phosphate ABC transporter substrate-binding protein [Leptospiraceae bacterium]|nr:phosphate ABC transporter substrate-binding protein [Leptospiraceae bacterium]
MKSIIVFLLIIAGTFNCKKEVLTVSGSETMHEMILQVSQAFMKQNSNFLVDVKGGGSIDGLEKLVSKQANIALVSLEPNSAEVTAIAKNQKFENVVIGYDGAAIVVHPSNSLNDIHLEDVAKIFSGEVKNWKEVGGKDQPILLILRNDKSGTSYYFKEHILRKKDLGLNYYSPYSEFSTDARIAKDNSELIDILSKESGGIAFIGMGFLPDKKDKIKSLRYARKQKDEFVEPTLENVLQRKYRLSRGLYLIYPENTEKKILDYITFATSEEGQKAILKSGYLRSTLPEVRVEEKR